MERRSADLVGFWCISKTGKNSGGLPRPPMSSRHLGALGVTGEHPALQEQEKAHVSSLERSGALGSR